jgi:hypothetical protein
MAVCPVGEAAIGEYLDKIFVKRSQSGKGPADPQNQRFPQTDDGVCKVLSVLST